MRTLMIVVVLLVGACGSDDPTSLATATTTPADTGSTTPADHGWTELPAGPLGERSGASIAAVGDDVVVFGGSDDWCPPTADCAQAPWPPFASGAAWNVATESWRPIADAPAGIEFAETAVDDGSVYAFLQCVESERCPDGPSTLRYRVADDEWDRLAPVPDTAWHRPVVVDGRLFAIVGSNEWSEGKDWSYDESVDGWTALAPPPIPDTFDRFGVAIEGALYLFGSVLESDDRVKAVASLDPSTGSWTERSTGEGGYQPWLVDDLVYLNPHFSSVPGGVYDPTADEWRPLPSPPDGVHDLAGVIGVDSGVVGSGYGWVLDATGAEYLEVPPRSDLRPSGEAIVAVGRDLHVFGGLAFRDDEAPVWGGAWVYRSP